MTAVLESLASPGYNLDEFIRAGGYGVVYRVTSLRFQNEQFVVTVVLNSTLLTDLQLRFQTAQDDWPPEFPREVTRPDLERIRLLAADDQPILLKHQRMQAVICDTYRLVSDARAEHETLKRRVAWTEEEKETFREIYARHPKKFKRIADQLPNQQVKHVIEFSYLNWLTLELNNREPRRRRGPRVVSEGTVRHI
jgi:hypothetical protein